MKNPRKVAIVTGAGSGIGLATARLLAARGAAIVAIGRRAEPLEALAAELKDMTDVLALALDVTARDTAATAVSSAIERFGRLDYLVNNAGQGKPSPLHETSDDLLDAFLDIHLRTPFRFCREAVAVMQSGAAIVNVSSTFGIIGGLRGGAYSAAKAGVIGLTKHMAAQYGPSGIRSNVVAPGVTETPMTAYNWENERFRRMNFEMTPMNRTCSAENVGEAIVFLLSDAAGFINGHVLAVDGGWTSTKFLSEEALSAERVR
jgi:meso-butanediol dehydrogenase/(S,S)-butanediol dehydrogenase/diacetyl reductase